MDEQAFGARIKIRREEVGISQKDVASTLNIDQGKVSLIEKGLRRVDPVKELPALAKLLKVPISWFYAGMDVPKDQSPVESLLEQYFPGNSLMEDQIERISQFVEIAIEGYVKTDPSLKKQVSAERKTQKPQEKPENNPTEVVPSKKKRAITDF